MRGPKYCQYLSIIEDFRHKVDEWTALLPGLATAQRSLQDLLGESDYCIETPIVFNRALSELKEGSTIRWIIVADNPGKREQARENRRYLVGKSGIMAENFFRERLHIDFRAEVLIINKSPIHTPKTSQLGRLIQEYPEMGKVFRESQVYMAGLAWRLQELTNAPLWLMGLSELRQGGLFADWYERFRAERSELSAVFVFNHFSMGSFSSDLKRRTLPGEDVESAVLRIGSENRKRIFPEPRVLPPHRSQNVNNQETIN